MREFLRSSWPAWGALLLLVALTGWWSWTRQAPISLQGGLGWDGVDYAAMADQLGRGEAPRAAAPFVYRIGAPALAAWIAPGDVLAGFRWLNGGLALLLPLLLFAWLRRVGLRPATALLLSGLFATQWHAPLRMTPFYPVHADPLLWAFWLLALLGLEWSRAARESRRLLGWSAFALLAVPVREVLLLPILAQAVQGLALPDPGETWRTWGRRLGTEFRWPRLLPLALGLAVFLLIQLWAEPVGRYSFLKTAVLWLWLKSVPHYLHGLCQALGPGVLVLMALGWRRVKLGLARRPELLLWLAGVLALGWLGGSDTERLLYWGAPLFLWLAGLALEANWATLRSRPVAAAAWLGFLGLGQLLSQRMFWLIPDAPGSERLVWPLLTPLSSTGRYLDLWSQHAVPEVAVLSLAQYLLWIAVGWWWGRRLWDLSPQSHGGTETQKN